MSVGILNGNGTDANGYTEYLPNNNTRRSEAATIIMNMLKYLGEATGELTPIEVPDKPAEKEVLPDVLHGPSYPNGVCNPTIAREKDIEALEATRCGKDEQGYFVEFTAPRLTPDLEADGFVYYFYAQPEGGGGGSNVLGINEIVEPGTSKKCYFELRGGGQPKDAHFSSMTYSVKVMKVIGGNPDSLVTENTASMWHSITSGWSTALEEGHFTGWSDETGKTNSKNNHVPINTDQMFEGLSDILKK